MHETKLIVLRGPSGAGKSTVAKELREHLKDSAALIEQDYFRRIVLKEKCKPDSLNARLIADTTVFALGQGYHVILEGIFDTSHYQPMFDQLWQAHPDQNHVYYFDVLFEETLRRHITKPNAHEFGEAEMRDWWADNDLLGLPNEQKIFADLTATEIAERILRDAGLQEL